LVVSKAEHSAVLMGDLMVASKADELAVMMVYEWVAKMAAWTV
jgi:hypothetical protein